MYLSVSKIIHQLWLNKWFFRFCILNGSVICYYFAKILLSLGLPCGSELKNPLANARDTGLITGSGRSLGAGNGNPLQYSCRKIPRTEEPGGLQSVGSQRVRHNWANKQQHQVMCHKNHIITDQKYKGNSYPCHHPSGKSSINVPFSG